MQCICSKAGDGEEYRNLDVLEGARGGLQAGGLHSRYIRFIISQDSDNIKNHDAQKEKSNTGSQISVRGCVER